MQGEGGTSLSKLEAAIREFQAREDRRVDLKGLRAGIDALEGEFGGEALEIKRSGDHLVGGNISAATWIRQLGGMLLPSAQDPLLVGQEPASRPCVAARRADALTEVVYKAMNEGQLPKRNGVRPHITITTTIEGLKGELGAAASELEAGMPISSKTVQRFACDGTLSRVLKADSLPIDVGRATRALSPAQRPALKAHYRGCCGPRSHPPTTPPPPHPPTSLS